MNLSLGRFFKVHEQGECFPTIIKLALFLNLFISIYFFRSPFDFYYGYLAYILLFPKFLSKYGIPRIIGIIFSIPLISGFYHISIGNNTAADFIKVFAGLLAAYLFFYYIVFELGIKVASLFKFYLAGSLFCAAFGILQMFTYLLGNPIGIGFPWLFGFLSGYPGGLFGLRISTFFGEPSYYAIGLSAAIFVAIHDIIFQSKAFFFNYLTAVVLLLGAYFSFSGMIAGTIALSFLAIAINQGGIKYYFLILPFALFGLNQVVTSSEGFDGRLEGTLGIFLDAPQGKFNVFKYHGSSVILYNNFFVAKENFKKNPLFGTGIGSHPVAFEKYSLTKDVKEHGFALNSKDANSMFNRLLSETGIFGLGLFALLIFGFYTRKNPKHPEDQMWIISSACLIIILINFARQGHYFLNGFPFFVWIFYKIGLDRKKQNSSLSNNADSEIKI